jgi:hypothetical protein
MSLLSKEPHSTVFTRGELKYKDMEMLNMRSGKKISLAI